MYKLALSTLLLILPLLAAAAGLNLTVDLSGFDPAATELPAGWGKLSAPGYPQLPIRTINIVLPPRAADLQFTYQMTAQERLVGSAPVTNPPFYNEERLLAAPDRQLRQEQVQYLGLHRWGDVRYASFRVLPAIWTGVDWQCWRQLELSLDWSMTPDPLPNHLPDTYVQLSKSPSGQASGFFANPGDLNKYYALSNSKNYDYLIIGTPELYAAIAPMEAFRQGQGLITAFADIAVILASSPGASPGEKLRNYLVDQYSSQSFTYLLLLGDHDTVPVLYVIPEPDGYETIPTDFFYGDLSSIIDTDSDGRLGEYSPGFGLQDYLCDFTPELFVGRISTNSATIASQIATRTVAYEQTSAPWKRSALLPAAYLNYSGEPETMYLQTDGATFMEYARATVLSDWQCTTMYEQTGYLPSYPSDYPLDYDGLKNLLSTQSYGILNWSAHGSATSSSRKVWMSDDNQNGLPDSWEMTWMNMVGRQSFDNLTNQDGLILFAASCYNGMIDYDQQSLAEYALQKKAVASMGATRTGWYKLGWSNPGWGGLSSYNLHWLENFTRNWQTCGAALAFANLTHTQFYLFGDPVDAGGIIWPELQNVYAYLYYGDPAVGNIGQQNYTQGEILVYEPWHHNGLPVVNALNQVAHFNVVYTDKLIPDYDYINQFEAVFCLFGWGDTAYVLHPDSLDYSLLNSYLNAGGKLYLEGDVGWDPEDPFWGKFGTHAPLDFFAYIEGLQTTQEGHIYAWDYDDEADPYTQILVPYAADAEALITTFNSQHPDHTVGILHATDTYATLASSFALADVDASAPSSHPFPVLIGIILDGLGVIDYIPVPNNDPMSPMTPQTPSAYPNPFTQGTSLRVDLQREANLGLEIFNLRGQKIRALPSVKLAAGMQELRWDGLDSQGRAVAPGIYFWRLRGAGSAHSGKILKLAKN